MYVLFEIPPKSLHLPTPFKRTDILPHIDDVLEKDRPVTINSLSFMGISFGFLCTGFELDSKNYNQIPQFVNAFSHSISTYRNTHYLQHVANELENIYEHDYMTKLLNRSGFYKHLPELCEKARQTRQQIAVCSVDMDRLKYINDTFKHEEGDFAICQIAAVLDKLPYEDKLCTRFGGDEFILVALINDATHAESILQKQLQDSLIQLNTSLTKPYTISASLGMIIADYENFDIKKASAITAEAFL